MLWLDRFWSRNINGSYQSSFVAIYLSLCVLPSLVFLHTLQPVMYLCCFCNIKYFYMFVYMISCAFSSFLRVAQLMF